MRQIRITTQNIDIPSDDDCFIDENDPMWAIKRASFLGGLGMGPIMSEYNKELIKKFWPEKEDDNGNA